ncbi:DUF2442 domain-containing protein [Erythrobacter sp. EC-HK427]|uniref:DUF2442 domain-containing protein n=1 Tax=Erythrobacter sp. EC-HK427 TaxID=2038396 RepID=UPI001256FA16|nr:DUF2442 domain-containing protein [Erythrobacter sp. EC-HK427]VVT05788.1 conserved hypothetical protein [Erythrobacter sp. EC-HK427]
MDFSTSSEADFPEPVSVRFDEGNFWTALKDGRVIGVPLIWFPRLFNATAEQLEKYELSPSGIHWDEIDEDISVKSIVLGYKSHEFRAADAA